MIDKYQLYMVYKNIKKMWNAKRFNTNVFREFFADTMENYIINQFVQDSQGMEYMSNYCIPLANEMNCSFTDLEHWTMYVMMKCLCDKKCPELKDVNAINKLLGAKVFTKRAVITRQIDQINKIIEERNNGFDYFTDNRFSLYELDENQENQAYKMYCAGTLDPEFYIQGLYHEKFKLNKDSIKNVEYKRFITFCEMIIKLHKEISEKNKSKKKNT